MRFIKPNQVTTAEQGFMVDVRDEAAFHRGHIPGSMNVPVEELRHVVEELKGFPRVILVCGQGKRAVQAGEILSTLGIAQVEVLEGGIHAWQKLGRALAKTQLPLSLNADQKLRLTAGSLAILAWLFPPLRRFSALAGLGLILSVFYKDFSPNWLERLRAIWKVFR